MRRAKSSATAPACDVGVAIDDMQFITGAAPPIVTDAPSVRRQARDLNRKLRPAQRRAESTGGFTPQSAMRFDPPQNLFDHLDTLEARPVPPGPHTPLIKAKFRRPEAGQIFAWLVVALGALVLGVGICLIAWSISNNETTHWNVALGLALGGQGGLIFGLVLVVSRLWRNSRFASLKLQEVHARLAELQQTADVLATMRGGAPAFYADLARGASPHMLLSNLKGQLDQLAVRLGSSC
jgi:hypothetical protein